MIHKLFSSFLFKLVFCEEKRWPSMCVSCNKIVMHDLIYLPHHSAPLNGVVSSQTRKNKIKHSLYSEIFRKNMRVTISTDPESPFLLALHDIVFEFLQFFFNYLFKFYVYSKAYQCQSLDPPIRCLSPPCFSRVMLNRLFLFIRNRVRRTISEHSSPAVLAADSIC